MEAEVMNSSLKTKVLLSEEQRADLERLARSDQTPARAARCARVLLHADQAHSEGRRSDEWIADALGMHVNTVARMRKQFVNGGEAAALTRKPRVTPPVPPKVDGRVEAHIIAICCSQAPEGRTRWTMQMVADELVARGVITSISAETVRLVSKKTNFSPGKSNAGASPSETEPGSSRRWKQYSTSMPRNTPKKRR
jgi:transposase